MLKKAEEIPQNKRRESLINNKDKALLSRKLVTLKNDVPVKDDPRTFIMKKVNTKCDFRQFRLDSKSYNFIFCVFFVFLNDRKCRPLSSFSKSGGFR